MKKIRKKRKTREDIVNEVLVVDKVKPAGKQIDIEAYKDKMLDEAINELLPDGILIANHAWLLSCSDPKIKLEALRMIYQLKGLLKQDSGVTVTNVMANMSTKSLEELDAEISKLEKRTKKEETVEGEIISDDDKK